MSSEMPKDLRRIYAELAASTPQLAAGLVSCVACGREERVDSAHCLEHGWPICCGRTMSLGPIERGGEGRENR
jgi:hypothetical protein